MALPACLHCRTRAQRPRREGSRGLCRVCYYTPEVRALYTPWADTGRAVPARGNRATNLYGLAPRAVPEPTDAEPGTPAKVAVLAERFRRRQELWHPRDRRLPRPNVGSGVFAFLGPT